MKIFETIKSCLLICLKHILKTEPFKYSAAIQSWNLSKRVNFKRSENYEKYPVDTQPKFNMHKTFIWCHMVVWRAFRLGLMTTWYLIIGNEEHGCNTGFLFLNKTFDISLLRNYSFKKIGCIWNFWVHIITRKYS